MIEPTDEMVTAAAEVIEEECVRRRGHDLGTIHRDDIVRAGLAAVLALVERRWQEQYGDAFQAGWWRGQHELCPRCGVELEREVNPPTQELEKPRWRCNRTSRCIREDGHTGPHAFTGLDPQ